MDKEEFIRGYIDLETNTLVRKDKQKRFDELLSLFISSNYGYSHEDIIEIANELINKEVTIRHPLFQKLLYPYLSEQVEFGNTEAIKVLIKLEQHLISYQGNTKDYKYSSFSLLDKGLAINPNDKELLEIYEAKTRQYINHTLHELPSGVLYGMDGASIEECDELLEMVNQYEIVTLPKIGQAFVRLN